MWPIKETIRLICRSMINQGSLAVAHVPMALWMAESFRLGTTPSNMSLLTARDGKSTASLLR